MKDARIRFDTRSPFYTELKERVDAWFEASGQRPRDHWKMYLKTAIIMAWWLGSLVAFLTLDVGWLGALGLGVSLGLSTGGLGMSVMHDGGHKAYSDHKWVNAAMAWVIDLIGASSYVWNEKHNVRHHTYPNVVGSDDDVDIGPLARLAPGSPRYGFHRWQHLYMWPLYGFITIKWHWWDDFYQIARGRIGAYAFNRPTGGKAAAFWAGRVIFFGWALVLPIMYQPVALALTFYFVAQFVQGVVLAATFQMAHCVEEARYFEPSADGSPVDLDFARHQLATTIDFATENPLATWYMGGLNFQAVHHLFPRVCHVHYPAISRIVAEVAAKHDQPYTPTPSVRLALASHYRWLRTLGQPGAVPVVGSAVAAVQSVAGHPEAIV